MRTCTTMIYTDGTETVYAVFQGKMRGRYFDLHSAEQVGQFHRKAGATDDDYRRMTAKYATLEAPAVSWQA